MDDKVQTLSKMLFAFQVSLSFTHTHTHTNAESIFIIKKAREFRKNIYFCFIDYVKAFDYVDHNKLCKILKDM